MHWTLRGWGTAVAGTRTRVPCGARGQNHLGPTRESLPGPELDFGLGPLRVTRRATCGLPAGYPHTGPVWAPRTKSHGSHAGIPCGTRIRDITGPVRDPGQCVGWVSRAILYSVCRNAQPVKSGQRVSGVMGRSQVKDHTCGSVQYRL